MSGEALRVAREAASGLDPARAADRIGAQWDEKKLEFRLPVFGSLASVAYPSYEVAIDGRPAPPHLAALLVYHLSLSDGSMTAGEWISFASLPDAAFYVTAFRGYTGAMLVRRFAATHEVVLGEAVERVGGEKLAGFGDRAWRIPALPRVPLALLWWNASEEFDARAELLFDSTAARHLTTDGCAVLGSWLTSLLSRGDA